jgi:large conductance mechanosensitive channel
MLFRIAAAFTTVVTSFVSEILLPPLSLIPGINRNMEGKFAILRRGPNYNTTDGIGYNTLQQAADDGAVVMAYGYFPFSSPLPTSGFWRIISSPR